LNRPIFAYAVALFTAIYWLPVVRVISGTTGNQSSSQIPDLCTLLCLRKKSGLHGSETIVTQRSSSSKLMECAQAEGTLRSSLLFYVQAHHRMKSNHTVLLPAVYELKACNLTTLAGNPQRSASV
jgi:hypothetical protein